MQLKSTFLSWSDRVRSSR